MEGCFGAGSFVWAGGECDRAQVPPTAGGRVPLECSDFSSGSRQESSMISSQNFFFRYSVVESDRSSAFTHCARLDCYVGDLVHFLAFVKPLAVNGQVNQSALCCASYQKSFSLRETDGARHTCIQFCTAKVMLLHALRSAAHKMAAMLQSLPLKLTPHLKGVTHQLVNL